MDTVWRDKLLSVWTTQIRSRDQIRLPGVRGTLLANKRQPGPWSGQSEAGRGMRCKSGVVAGGLSDGVDEEEEWDSGKEDINGVL